MARKPNKEEEEWINAAIAGRLGTLKTLHEKKIDINTLDFSTGNTALHCAVTGNLHEVIEWLLENGINPNIRNRRGQTALHISVEKRFDELTKWLIEKNVDYTIKDNLGQTPLDIAGRTPAYQGDLRDLIINYERVKVSQETTGNDTHEIKVYLKNGRVFPFHIKQGTPQSKIIEGLAVKLKITNLMPHIELVEDAMGKERKLDDKDNVIEIRKQWKNDNPQFFKFVAKLKRGAPEDIQLKFREAVYN